MNCLNITWSTADGQSKLTAHHLYILRAHQSNGQSEQLVNMCFVNRWEIIQYFAYINKNRIKVGKPKPDTMWVAVVVSVTEPCVWNSCPIWGVLTPFLMTNTKVIWGFLYLGITIAASSANSNITLDEGDGEGTCLCLNWVMQNADKDMVQVT